MLDARTQDSSPTGLYVKATFGIGIGLTPATMTQTKTTMVTEGSTTTIADAIKVNLGTGLPLGISAGYKFDDHYGVELGIDYFSGFSTSKTDSRTTISGGQSSTDEAKTKVSASMLSITPSFVMQTEWGKVFPYARIGAEIGVVNNYKTVYSGVTYLFKSSAPTGDETTKDYGGITIGVKAAVGVEYPITDLISLFGEIQARAISFSPKHGKVTKYTVNGQDELSTLTTKQSKWDFEKSIDSSVAPSADQPNQVLRVTHSLSNVALAIGVKFNFGGK
jgi:hypothetical protein